MAENFIEQLSKHLNENYVSSRQRRLNPKLVSEARAWYQKFVGKPVPSDHTDEEVVEIYEMLHNTVDK